MIVASILTLLLMGQATPDQNTASFSESASTKTRLLVSEEGNVERCEVTKSSGNRNVDGAVCKALKKLAKFSEVVTYPASGKGVEYAEVKFNAGKVNLDAPNSWDATVIIRKRVEFKLGDDELPRGGAIMPWEKI